MTAGLGGLGPAPLNAPPGAAAAAGVQPGVTQGVVVAHYVIIIGAGGGIFLYSGTPGEGTLIASLTAEGGTDQWGNAYGPGFNIGMWGSDGSPLQHFGVDTSGNTYQYDDSAVSAVLSDVVTHSHTYYDSAGFEAGALVAAVSGEGGSDSVGNAYAVGYTGNTTAFEPGSSPQAVESWHDMSLLNSWSPTYARYRMLPDGNVQCQGIASDGTITAGTAVFQFPSAYTPSYGQVQTFPCMILTSTGSAGVDTPRISVNDEGNLYLEEIPSGTTEIGWDLVYSLT